MTWHAQLSLDYVQQDQRTILRHSHEGPLRIFKSLYPEGPSICHNVIVHPPGGIVGGDRLDINVRVGSGAHGLVSTPGATRFYQSDAESGQQSVRLHLEDGARLEWLPLESIAYPGCRAINRLQMHLEGNAQMIGWDVVGLGLPAAGQPFTHGEIRQQIEWPGIWLEQGTIQGADERLLNSPLGLDGQRSMATMWLACAQPLDTALAEDLLEAVRACRSSLPADAGGARMAATCPGPHVLVIRGIAPLVEPLMHSMQQVWRTLRERAWGLPSASPRIWQV